MLYIGLDVHQKKTKVAILDNVTGEFQKPYDVRTSDLPDHMEEMPGRKRIAMETSTVSQFVARRMRSSGLDVMMVDAAQCHLLLGGLSRSKTDKLDATGLCVLLSKGMLETVEVWLPDDAIQELRELTRLRRGLMKNSVSMQNRIRKLLSRQGMSCPYDDLQGQSASKWLDEAIERLSPIMALTLSTMREGLADLTAQIDTLTEAIQSQTEDHEPTRLLQTIPGVGPLLAAIIAAEIGDIARFESACKLRGYTGLVPRVDQSGETRRTGPLVKHANRFLRWALIQTAQNFAHNTQTRDLRMIRNYGRKVYTYGPNPAKVHLARRIVNVIFAMLRDGTEFDARLLARAEAA